jgi:hypothetical protein
VINASYSRRRIERALRVVHRKDGWSRTDDDEVILSGGTGTGGPVDTTIKIGVDAPLAAPGRYRFVR